MRDQRGGLEAGAVGGVAVGAADALAVGGEGGQVGRLREARRRPLAQHVGQGVRVGVREHPAEGRVRRRRPAPVGVAPRPQNAQFALVEAAREPFRRHRPELPGEPGEGADRQHRRQAVLAPLAAPAVGHRREQVAQRAQFRSRVAHRRRPARPLRAVDRIRQPRRRVPPQRTDEHHLRRRVRIRVRAVVPREAPRAPQPRPVRGVVAAAPIPQRVHERLRQLQRVAVRRPPVRAQPPQAQPQRPRGQVPHPQRLGQNQEPRVVADQVQPPELHRAVPAQPAVPRRALEGARLPAHQRQPMPPPHRHVPQPAPRELPEPQIVVRRHQRVPPAPLVRPRRTHLHLPQRHFRPVERRLHRPFIGQTPANSQLFPDDFRRQHLGASVK